ncbi:MAG: hypothetical protein SPL09_00750, partial [Eubacteriales bacterium]|nr:hypothetical protein [Eubacteriales bacterium]
VFPLHGLYGNHPLLAIFAGIHTVDQLAVGNRLAQRTFIQPPKPGGVGKGHEPVEGRLDRLSVLK